MAERSIRRRALTAALAPAALMLIAGWAGLGPVGISTDEPLHRKAGAGLLRYYATWGGDDSVIGLSNTRWYGGLFDLAGALLERALPGVPWHLPRHALSVVCGALGIWFAARTAALLGGAGAGLLAGSILLLTPRWFGHSLFNPKDIPFAAAYAAAAFFMTRLALELPRPRGRSWVAFAVAAGCALGVRVGGLVLPCLLAVVLAAHLALRARDRAGRAALLRDSASLGVRWALASAGALALAVAVWPYLRHDTFARLLETLRVNTDFPHPLPVRFGGEFVPAGSPGWRYLPVWLAIALPVGLQAGAVLGSAAAFSRRAREAHRTRPEALLAVLLAAYFPLAYAMARQSLLYNGIRHFLFVLPPLAALAGWGWWVAIGACRRTALRRALVVVLALAMVEPLVWIVRSHPLEYTYFNPLGGGIARLGHRYDGDYWRMSLGPLALSIDRALDELPEGRRLALAIRLPEIIRFRMRPLMRHGKRLNFVDVDDPRAHLRVVGGGRCARDAGLPQCFFVSRVVPEQRPFLVVEKTSRFEREFAPSKRRRRSRGAER